MLRVHHLALRARDPEALAAFYRDVIGLPLAERQGNGIWLRAGDIVLMIERAAPDEPSPDPASLELLAFTRRDLALEGIRAHLLAQSVMVEAETLHTLYFRDPEGRRVALSDADLGDR